MPIHLPIGSQNNSVLRLEQETEAAAEAQVARVEAEIREVQEAAAKHIEKQHTDLQEVRCLCCCQLPGICLRCRCCCRHVLFHLIRQVVDSRHAVLQPHHRKLS